MRDEPWLSVVIPAYNEAERIHGTLDRTLAYLRARGRPFEIVVVDDGSRDGTGASVERRCDPEIVVLTGPTNRGKGASTRRGVAATRGERVLLMDADLAIPIEEIERLEALLQSGVAVACGSRGLPGSRVLTPQPAYRQAMGRAFNWILRRLGLTELRDTQCGFKLFSGEAARTVFARCRIDGFASDVESLLVARRLGYRCAEIPVSWRHVPESRVHPLRDAGRMLVDVLRLRLTAGSLYTGVDGEKGRSA